MDQQVQLGPIGPLSLWKSLGLIGFGWWHWGKRHRWWASFALRLGWCQLCGYWCSCLGSRKAYAWSPGGTNGRPENDRKSCRILDQLADQNDWCGDCLFFCSSKFSTRFAAVAFRRPCTWSSRRHSGKGGQNGSSSQWRSAAWRGAAIAQFSWREIAWCLDQCNTHTHIYTYNIYIYVYNIYIYI